MNRAMEQLLQYYPDMEAKLQSSPERSTQEEILLNFSQSNTKLLKELDRANEYIKSLEERNKDLSIKLDEALEELKEYRKPLQTAVRIPADPHIKMR